MKTTLKTIILIGMVLLISNLASAVDYYFSNSTGLDTNKCGIADPCATLNKLMSFSNITSGDNFYFKRGDTWREWFNYTGTQGSSESSRVSFKAYGTGEKPKFIGSKNYSQLTWTNTTTLWRTGNQILNNTVNMIWCNGIRGQNKSSEELLTSNCDFYYNTTSKNITIYYNGNLTNVPVEIGQIDIPGLTDFWRGQSKNYLTFENLYFGYINNKAYYSQLGTGVRFTNLTFEHTWNNAIYINGDSSNPYSKDNDVIDNCSFFDTGLRGVILGGGGETIWVASMENTTIKNSTLINPHGVGINFFKGMGGTVENNTVIDCEQDQSDGNPGIYYDQSNNTISRWNKVINCTVGMSINAETASSISSNNTMYHNYLYGNNISFVVNSNQNLVTIFNTNISDNTAIKINNNTGGYKYFNMLKYFQNLTHKDNLYYSTNDTNGQVIQLTNYTGFFTTNNNFYNQTLQNIVFEVNGTNKTVSEWQTYGYDTNGIFTGNPYLNFLGIPYANSPVCDAANDSTDIGTYDCEVPNKLYVNVSKTGCSDTYNRLNASNPSTPWCGTSSTSMDKVLQNDTVIIAEGIYPYKMRIRNKPGNITFTSATNNNVILTRADTNFYYKNASWTNVTTSGANFSIWKANFTTTSDCVYAYENGTNKLFYPACVTETYCINEACTSSPTMNFSWWNTTLPYDSLWHNNSDNEVYIKFNNQSKNPNNMSLWVGAEYTITIENVTQAYTTFENLTVHGFEVGAYMLTSPVANITFKGIKSIGAVRDFQFSGNARNVSIINSTGNLTRWQEWTWQYEHDIERNYVYMEHAEENNKVNNNTINGYTNAIVPRYLDSYGLPMDEYDNLEIAYNHIFDIRDDAIEAEDYANCYDIHHNNIHDVHVVLTLTPSNSSVCQSKFRYNLAYANLSQTIMSGTMRVFKLSGASAQGETSNWNITHNTMKGDNATLQSAVLPNMLFNFTFLDNIFMDNNNSAYLIERTGTPAQNNTWDYNLYYKTGSGNAFIYYMNDTDSTPYKNLSHAQTSGSWNGIQDTNSIWANPVLNFLGVPYESSPVCGAASDGGDIGAFECGGELEELSAPSNAQLLNRNTTWLYFNWSVNNGTYYTNTKVFVDDVFVANYTTTTTEYNLTGLTENTVYQITLRNYDSYGFTNETNTSLRTLRSTTISSSNLANYTILEWRMENDGATKTLDTKNKYNATKQGGDPGHTTGIINQAITGDSTDGRYLNFGEGIYPQCPESVSFWYQTNNDFSSSSTYLFGSSGSACSGTTPSLSISTNSAGYDLVVALASTNSISHCRWNLPSTHYNGSWHHLALTNNGTTNVIYYDGNLVTGTPSCYETGTMTGDINTATFRVLDHPSTGYKWSNPVDEMIWFNKSLNTTEINYLYAAGAPTTTQEYPFSTEEVVFLSPTPTNSTAIPLINNTFYINTSTGVYMDGLVNTTHYVFNTTTLVRQFNETYGNGEYISTITGLPVGSYTFNATSINETTTFISETRSFTIYNFSVGSLNTSLNNTNITSRYLNISWTNGTPNINHSIIHLYNSTYGYVATIINTTNLNYTWDVYNQSIPVGTYYLVLNQTDNAGQKYTDGTYTLINIIVNAFVNVTAKTVIGNIVISNFSGWVYNYETDLNQTYITTSGQALVDTVLGNLTIYFDPGDSYATNDTIAGKNATTIQTNHQFLVYQTNTLNVTFHNQNTPSVILSGPNITMDLISDTYSTSNWTTNGTMYLTLLVPETYTLRYRASGYAERFYLFTMTNKSYNTLQLYLINNTANINLTVSVVDELASPVSGVSVKSLKYDLATNTYILQEVREVDSNGQTVFSVTYNDEFYKFIVEDSDGTVLKITDPSYITSSALTIQVNTEDEYASELEEYESLSYALSFNTGSNNFRLDYSDSNNIIEGVLLTVYTNENMSRTLYNDTLSPSPSGTILISVEESNGTTYSAYAYYVKDGEYKYLTGKTHTFLDTSRLVWGTMGLFAQILLTLGLSALSFISPVLGLVLAPLSLVLGAYLGWIQFSPAIVAGTVLVVGIILAIIISMRR